MKRLSVPFHQQRQRGSVAEERGLLGRQQVEGKVVLQLAVISRHLSLSISLPLETSASI